MSTNTSSMNRAALYRQAKQNAVELGYNLQPLRDKWRRSTVDYWRGEITKMKRNIANRDRRFNKALEINRQSRYPLSMPDKQGTDYKTWNREVRRLQMRIRRKPPTHTTRAVLQQIKQRPDQMRVVSRTRTFKNELEAMSQLLRFNTTTTNNRNGSTRIEYVHTIPDSMRLRLNEDDMNLIRNQIQAITNKHKNDIGGKRMQILLRDTGKDITISTAYLLGVDTTTKELMKEIGYKAREYGENSMSIDEITIATLTPPQDLMGSSVPRSIITSQ